MKQEYLEKYKLRWDALDVVVNGKSVLDSSFYAGPLEDEQHVRAFLRGYGFDGEEPIQLAEVFGSYQEAVQFIKRYLLDTDEPQIVNLKMPDRFFAISNVMDVFQIADGRLGATKEEALWGMTILKVMHIILHADKDLRQRYFPTIQTQILDRFYKYLHRDDQNNLFLKAKGQEPIALVDFQAKSRKTRESTLIKLLHKKENVAEELFDRIGVRFITRTKFDVLRVIHFLCAQHIITIHNTKPSRAQNTLITLDKFQESYKQAVKIALKENWTEEAFLAFIEAEACESLVQIEEQSTDNSHTSRSYRSIHFTCRQLIKYRNPFAREFAQVRELAKEQESELAHKILNLNTAYISRDLRFFYPFEVQITDEKSHEINTQGEASHEAYKESQLRTARMRLFKPLIEFYQSKPSE